MTRVNPRKSYGDQKHHAVERGIPFLISYEDWLEMWLVSGQWTNRGKNSGNFVMCRYGDSGPYSKRNCYIGSVEQNQRDRWEGVEKIDNQKAEEIYKIYITTNKTQKEIGKDFGVDQSYVSRIVNKKRKNNAS